MRLTLRTILAYLDDILEPGEAREIGEKISESKEAADLVARIRDVIRRRRIGAPELAGPGSGPDPNLVSDYLENLLPANQVMDLERLCQASDVHLAEVAACHKILSLVMGQPIDVPDEMRERMYALGAARNATLPAESTEQAMAEGMSGVETEAESGLPEYLTRRSFLQKYGNVLLIAAGTLFWIFLVWTDRALWTRQVPVDSAASVAQNGETAAQPQPAQVPVAVPAAAESIAAPAAGVAVTPATPVVVPPAPTAPAAGEMKGANTTPGAAPPLPVPPPVPAMPLPMPEDGDVAETPMELPFIYTSGDEFVIKRLAGKSEWIVHPITVGIEAGDELASPAPFQNTYSVDNVIDVSLQPDTRVLRLPRKDTTVLGLALNRGQIVLSRPLTSADAISVELQAAGRSWILKFLEPGTQCAVDVTPPHVAGAMDNAGRPSPAGGIVVISGKLNVTTAQQEPFDLQAKSGFVRWPAQGDMLVLQADLGIPGWAVPADVMVTPAAKQLSRLFQKEFIADRTVAQSIGPVVDDRRAGISELAVKTLSLIDEYPFLVEALQSNHQESRLAAIEGLREWLALSPENRELLRTELGQVFREEYVSTLETLLWGFTDRDARDPARSRQLLDWMKDDQIAIRQLAFEFVSRVVGKTYDYLPMAPVAERRAAMVRWEEYLKRSGGALLPAEPAQVE